MLCSLVQIYQNFR